MEDHILKLYDSTTGRLSAPTVKMIQSWRTKKGPPACCSAPDWKVDNLLRAFLPVVESGNGIALVDTSGPSVPVICFNCENCGYVASYLAEIVFPGWRDLQAPPAR